MNPNPRPSGSHEVLENSVKTKTDAVAVESDHENLSEKKIFELETESEDSEAVADTELFNLIFDQMDPAEFADATIVRGDERPATTNYSGDGRGDS